MRVPITRPDWIPEILKEISRVQLTESRLSREKLHSSWLYYKSDQDSRCTWSICKTGNIWHLKIYQQICFDLKIGLLPVGIFNSNHFWIPYLRWPEDIYNPKYRAKFMTPAIFFLFCCEVCGGFYGRPRLW